MGKRRRQHSEVPKVELRRKQTEHRIETTNPTIGLRARSRENEITPWHQ
jgi:hypothetical protein